MTQKFFSVNFSVKFAELEISLKSKNYLDENSAFFFLPTLLVSFLQEQSDCPKEMAARRFLVGGNWKSNGTVASCTELATGLSSVSIPESVDVVVAPTSLHIANVCKRFSGPHKLRSLVRTVELTTVELSPVQSQLKC